MPPRMILTKTQSHSDMNITDKCVESYGRLKNLKLAGEEIGVPWQTVYVKLKAANVPVAGDKPRYGTSRDRLAAKSEKSFMEFVPFAKDMNRRKFQSKIDFNVLGYGVDIKAANKKRSSPKAKTFNWCFSLKKQELVADFFVCFAYEGDDIKHALLVPGEIARNYTSLSLSCSSRSKWWDYEVNPKELAKFFKDLKKAA